MALRHECPTKALRVGSDRGNVKLRESPAEPGNFLMIHLEFAETAVRVQIAKNLKGKKLVI
jgi:hypothetical protein